MSILQRVLATIFVLLCIVHVGLAIAFVLAAEQGWEYLFLGVAALVSVGAGCAYLVAAAGVVRLTNSWRTIAFLAASMSVLLSIFVGPSLPGLLLISGAVIVGVLRHAMRTPARVAR